MSTPTPNRALPRASSNRTWRKKGLALAVGQALLLGTMGVQAATITVNDAGDPNGAVTTSGVCTLRDAIQAANTASAVDACVAGDAGVANSIVFDSSLTTSATTITLGGAELDLTSAMSIDGAQAITVSANAASRVFYVNGASVSLSGLTISGGSTTGYGGGIYATQSSSVSLSNSTLSGNSASYGGGMYVTQSSSVSLSNSTLSGNSATYGGGMAAWNSSVSLSNSTVSGNSANSTGGIAIWSSSANLSNSTLSGNSATSYGGGISAWSGSSVSLSNSTLSGNSAARGGGMYAGNSSVSLSNSTLSGNSAAHNGGGIYATQSSSVSLSNSTLAGNSASSGGGMYARNSSSISLSNSIIANSSGGDCVNSGSTVTADAYNIIADGSCATAAQSVDPLLGPLADNGGPTQTLLPQTGSPAIDGGDQAACTANNIVTDQRGYFRTDGKCDIGAVEVNGLAPTLLQFTATRASVNENGVSITLDVSRSGGTSNAVSVDYTTVDGTAVSTPLSSADYIAATGTLDFAAGETTKTITVSIVDQGLTSGSKTFTIVLSNPTTSTGVATLGTNTTQMVTILDNDTASGSGGGGATSPWMLLLLGLLLPLRRWWRRG